MLQVITDENPYRKVGVFYFQSTLPDGACVDFNRRVYYTAE